MAVNPVDGTKPFGALTLQLISKAAECRALALRIKDAAAATAQTGGTDWTRLEGGDFGFGTGKGNTVFDNVNAIYLALSTGDADNAIKTLDRGA